MQSSHLQLLSNQLNKRTGCYVFVFTIRLFYWNLFVDFGRFWLLCVYLYRMYVFGWFWLLWSLNHQPYHCWYQMSSDQFCRWRFDLIYMLCRDPNCRRLASGTCELVELSDWRYWSTITCNRYDLGIVSLDGKKIEWLNRKPKIETVTEAILEKRQWHFSTSLFYLICSL